jgi:hypothetical protein
MVSRCGTVRLWDVKWATEIRTRSCDFVVT